MSKKWYQTAGKDADIVISTRIRLARNLKGYPFPCAMNAEQRSKVSKLVRDALENSGAIGGHFKYIELDKASPNELVSMVERHLISPDFARDPKGRALLLMDDESVSIMLCEEDHIRIQVMSQGSSLKDSFDMADKLDCLLSEKLSYAFDDKLGYLTACPTNLGTALRASVMVHLPAIESDGSLRRISESLSKLGLTIRGMYGEGSQSKAAIYQISNQETLGVSETATLEKLSSVLTQISKIERDARAKLLERPETIDTLWRSLGLLRSARMLSGDEFCNLFSAVRLGAATGKLDNLSLDMLSELFVKAQPATLMCEMKKNLSPAERDVARAELVRKTLG